MPVTPYIGHLAALTTALCWTASALCFNAAGRRVGSLPVNLIRLILAWLMFAGLGLLSSGRALPLDAPPRAWFWLSISGLIGFFIGDLCLFRSFLLVGPRTSMLIMSLAPPLTALMGYLALGERLAGFDWLAMAVTLGGVVWVVSERRTVPPPGPVPAPCPSAADGRAHAIGIGLAFLGALGQAGGLVTGKLGLRAFADPPAATHIRVTSAAVAFVVLFLVTRRAPRLWRALMDRRAMAITAVGAFAGPFLGVGLLMYAIERIPTGLAQTFVALTPVLIIPFSARLHGERVTWRAVLGALAAFAGVAILFR